MVLKRIGVLAELMTMLDMNAAQTDGSFDEAQRIPGRSAQRLPQLLLDGRLIGARFRGEEPVGIMISLHDGDPAAGAQESRDICEVPLVSGQASGEFFLRGINGPAKRDPALAVIITQG